RKFLRAQATETRAVVETLTVLALTRPDVAFTLTSDDRALIDVPPAAGPLERLRALWGAGVADTLLPIAHCEGPLEVRGFAQRPAQARAPGDLFPREPLTPDSRPLTPLLQVFDTYLLFQTDAAVAIVDQHSAHERVLYETVMRQLSGDGAPAQRLLLPLTVEFAPSELDA